MERAIAVLLLFAASVTAGFRSAARLAGRRKALCSLASSVRALDEAIGLARLPLPALLQNLSGARAFWQPFSENLARGTAGQEAAADAMHRAMASDGDFASLQKEDAALLIGYAGTLGCTDARTQRERTRLLLLALDGRLCDAEKALLTQGKLRRALGVLGGAAFAILLL